VTPVLLVISDIAVSGAVKGLDVNPLAVTTGGELLALDASVYLQ